MHKFLSKDRIVILKSVAAGVGIISFLSLVILTESMILWGLGFFGIFATYWFVPTWFSKDRQIEKRAIKCSPFKDVKTYGPTMPEYKFFSPEGTEVKNPSDKEKTFSIISLVIISAFLIFVAYDPLIKLFIKYFPSYETIIVNFTIILSASTPYLIRHFYCFTLNSPIDTSLQLFHDYSSCNGASIPYIHKYDNNTFRNTATSPSYSFLSYNIYHHR